MNDDRELLLECFQRFEGDAHMAAKAYQFIMEMESGSSTTYISFSDNTEVPPSEIHGEFEVTMRPIRECVAEDEESPLTSDDGVKSTIRHVEVEPAQQAETSVKAVEYPKLVVVGGERCDNLWNYIDEDGIWLSDVSFEDAYSFEDGCARVKRNGLWNIIDIHGRPLCKKWYGCINEFMNGFAAVRDNNRYNFIDNRGDTLFETWYDDVVEFAGDGLGRVKKNGLWWDVDSKGIVRRCEEQER